MIEKREKKNGGTSSELTRRRRRERKRENQDTSGKYLSLFKLQLRWKRIKSYGDSFVDDHLARLWEKYIILLYSFLKWFSSSC